jgi:formate dehydrogenase accessory protein FdhD
MTRFDLLKGTVTETCDIVAEEVPLRIVLNNIYTSIVWCSPSQFKELTTGFLYSEEILHNVDEIDSITTDEKENICNIQLKADIDLDSRLENRRGGARVVPLIKNSTSAYQHDDKITPVTSDSYFITPVTTSDSYFTVYTSTMIMWKSTHSHFEFTFISHTVYHNAKY